MFDARYRDFIRPNPRRELEDELRFHLDAETEALVAEGLSRDEARRQAIARFGDVDKFLGDCGASDRRRLRRKRRALSFDAFKQDAAYAFRSLLRRPAFTITAILVLALGIGANAAVLSVVDHVFVRPPAGIRAPNEIKRVYVERQDKHGSTYYRDAFTMPEARIIDSTLRGTFPTTIFLTRRAVPVAVSGGAPRPLTGAWVTPTYFSVLGVRPLIGSDFDREDARLGVSPTSAIVSWSFWQRELGAQPSAIGRTIVVDGSPVTVRGIAPRGFAGLDLGVTDVWLPLGGLTAFKITDGSPWYDNWGLVAVRVLARVPPGVDGRRLEARIEQAMDIAARVRAAVGGPPGFRVVRGIAAPILVSRGPGQVSRSEAIAAALAGLAFLLLIIAIANVGNLLLGRSLDRRRELAVRLALGMSRARLAVGVMIESTLIAIAASFASLILAAWIGRILRAMILPGVVLATGPVDLRIAVITFGAALLTGGLAAIVPLASSVRVDLVAMLKGTVRDGGARSRGRSILVGVQVGLSLTLLVGTGLIARSLYNIRTDDLGIDVERGIIVLASDSPGTMPLADIQRIVKTYPGVTNAALAAEAPLYAQLGARHLFTPAGDTIRTIEPGSGFVAAEPSYLSAIGTRLIRGRGFTADDGAGAPAVMIASEEFARRLWGAKDPLGQCVRVEVATNPCYTVIGIAENARVFDLVEDPRPTFYVPLQQLPYAPVGHSPPANALVVRAAGDPTALIARIRALVGDTGTTIRTRRVVGMHEMLEPRYQPWEFAARLFGGFAVVAIVLTIVGLNGVLSYLVSIRRRELGIRMALGATRSRVLNAILREGVTKIVAGAIAGILLSLVVARALRPLLFHVSPHDPLAMFAAILILVACALLASLLPGLRAMTISPSSALREE